MDLFTLYCSRFYWVLFNLYTDRVMENVSPSSRPDYYKFIEIIGFCLFAVYQILFLAKIILNFPENLSVGLLAVLLCIPLLGYILADLFSGIFHFIGDTFGSETMPFFGPNFFLPFRLHHVDEKGITRHSFFEVNGTNCLGSLIILAPAYYFINIQGSTGSFFLAALLWWFLLFVFLTNQIHRAAHLEKVSPFVAWLQQKRLILSPEHHQVHHTAPFRTYFCITSGWLNPVLGKSRIFDTIARLSRQSRLERRRK